MSTGNGDKLEIFCSILLIAMEDFSKIESDRTIDYHFISQIFQYFQKYLSRDKALKLSERETTINRKAEPANSVFL